MNQDVPQRRRHWRTRLQNEFFAGLSEEELPSNHVGREELEEFISTVESAAIARERDRLRREVEKRNIPHDSPSSIDMRNHGFVPYGEVINQAFDDLLASLNQYPLSTSEG
jgi:hypothetical protein